MSSFESGETSMSAFVISAGISIHRIINTEIQLNGYSGTRDNTSWINGYAHFLFAPSINFEDFTAETINNNESEFVISGKDSPVERQNIGFRAGFVMDFHTVKRISFSGRSEIGIRPGIKGKGFYLRQSLGITVNLF